MTGCSLHRAVRPWRRAAAAPFAALLLVGLAGCGGTQAYTPRSEFIPFTPEQRTVLEAHTGRAYRIQEGDILKVYFSYERSLNQDGVVVLSDGSVSLIGVDQVRIAGLTMAEADSLLTMAYAKEWREPALSVMIQETEGRKVYVLGEVRNPGFYKVPLGGIDIVNAITVAGGFVDTAAQDGTLIVRVNGDGYQFQEVNLKAFGTNGFAPFAATPLQPYDIVYVPRSRSGDFATFTKNVLGGLATITRMAYDLYNITRDLPGRY